MLMLVQRHNMIYLIIYLMYWGFRHIVHHLGMVVDDH